MHNSQSLLDVEDMEKLGHELVRLCDAISVFGLVDYQMGVAEEEILERKLLCILLFGIILICAQADTSHGSTNQVS